MMTSGLLWLVLKSMPTGSNEELLQNNESKFATQEKVQVTRNAEKEKELKNTQETENGDRDELIPETNECLRRDRSAGYI